MQDTTAGLFIFVSGDIPLKERQRCPNQNRAHYRSFILQQYYKIAKKSILLNFDYFRKLWYYTYAMRKITKQDIDSNSMNKLSKKIASTFLAESNVESKQNKKRAIIMAGIPGSGKTEFLGAFFKIYEDVRNNFIRIDLDEIVKIFEDYTPQTDFLFRKKGTAILNGIINQSLKEAYNIALDGTFGSDKSIQNIERLLKRGYLVQLYIMNEDIEQALNYTKIREKKEKRKITEEAFYESIDKIKNNLRKLPKDKDLRAFVVEKNMIERKWTIMSLEDYSIDNLYKK